MCKKELLWWLFENGFDLRKDGDIIRANTSNNNYHIYIDETDIHNIRICITQTVRVYGYHFEYGYECYDIQSLLRKATALLRELEDIKYV